MLSSISSGGGGGGGGGGGSGGASRPLLRTHISPRDRRGAGTPGASSSGGGGGTPTGASGAGAARLLSWHARRFLRRHARALTLLALAAVALRAALYAAAGAAAARAALASGFGDGDAPARVAHSTLQRASPYAYAAFFASEDFLPAIQVLLHSLSATSPAYPLVLGVVEGAVSGAALAAALRHATMPVEVQLWPRLPPPRGARQAARWGVNWTKLRLWQLEQYAKVLYLDADVLVLRNLDGAFEAPLGARASFLGTPDWGKWTRPGSAKMNGGVFLLAPSAARMARLTAFAAHTARYRSEEAEQGLFNAYFGAKACCLPHTFNAQKTLALHYPALFNLSDIKVLHFVGEKPWRQWGSAAALAAARARVPASERARRTAADEWDGAGDAYGGLHAMWQRAYLQLRSFDAWLTLIAVAPAAPGDASGDYVAPGGDGHGDADVAPAAPHALWPVPLRRRLSLAAAARAVAAGAMDTPYVGFVRRADEPPDWTAIDIGQSPSARKLYAWRVDPAPRGIAAAALAAHPALARRIDAGAPLLRAPAPPEDAMGTSDGGSSGRGAAGGGEGFYLRTHSLILHAPLLREFAEWARAESGGAALLLPRARGGGEDDVAEGEASDDDVAEVLLNAWVRMTSTVVVVVPAVV
jgi:hypothetical protein